RARAGGRLGRARLLDRGGLPGRPRAPARGGTCAIAEDPMTRASQRERAERFRWLHDGPEILVVGSVWDAGSAVLFEREGFAALATSSAGVAFALGYPDGERVPREELLAAIARITRATALPVSADVESGFGATVGAVVETCRGVLDAGAIGVNLE